MLCNSWISLSFGAGIAALSGMTGEICDTIALIGAMTGETFTPTAAICTAIDATCGTTFAITITATRDMIAETFAMISVI
jgi:hypothetical protein